MSGVGGGAASKARKRLSLGDPERQVVDGRYLGLATEDLAKTESVELKVA
jgi:hypothetical protein